MAQCGAGKHDQWRGYMTVLVVNDGIAKSISIHTVVIRPMIKFEVDKPWEYFQHEGKWTLAIRLQLSILSALDLDCVHHLPHALLQETVTYCLPVANTRRAMSE